MDFLDALDVLSNLLLLADSPSKPTKRPTTPARLVGYVLLLVICGSVLLLALLVLLLVLTPRGFLGSNWGSVVCGGSAFLLAVGVAYGLFKIRLIESYKPGWFFALVGLLTFLFTIALTHAAVAWPQVAHLVP
ncbi:hypothetical protein E5K00_00550 [Hymenobacter aquaticus]|uniref:Uncharacterized protein n=1 Tax=Hymenobacter aquaticus TaxID=1867101 RepID=A0A4Z0Q175_9BACT|nr:hypothetical protein [Hymenobacter aquaticus]TGE23737.1 hypothetical protein E5K00_00550 [Hymenobacter aquaticus]